MSDDIIHTSQVQPPFSLSAQTRIQKPVQSMWDSLCAKRHWPGFPPSSVFWRCRWEDNIKMNLQEVGRGGMDSIDLAQDGDR